MTRAGWLDALTYFSVVAVVVALVKNDLLSVPPIADSGALMAASALLLAGFAATAGAWRAALAAAGLAASYRDALASSGLSVFGKYLPGKVWVIAGMAGHIARDHDIAFQDASAAATRLQLVSIWVGLLAGAPALIALDVDRRAVLVGIAVLAAASALLALPAARTRIEAWLPAARRVYAYLWPKNSPLPTSLVLWLALAWIAWGAGFAMLVQSLTGMPAGGLLFLVFPFAAVIGLLVLIAPGGIGAREGVLALALSSFALDLEQVATVAVFSRAWFLFGEAAFFVSGWLAARGAGR